MQALFVHGMGRTPFSGWRMLQRLKSAGMTIHTFGYSTAIHDFSHISCRLSVRIASIASHGDYILIGHSLGGILLRAALAMLPATTRQPVRVFLLGSPTRSVCLARRLQGNLIYRALTRDCGQLLASEARMSELPTVAAPTTGIVGVRGLRLTAKVFSGEQNDGVVSVAEVSAPWIADVVRVPVGHTFLPASQRVAEIILEKMARA